MIPIRDNNPTARFPVVCVALIAANVAVFLLDRMTGTTEAVQLLTPYGIVERNHFVGGLSRAYAMVPADLTREPGLYWRTIFSSMFLHANLLHIGGNMLYLWVFGNNIEDKLGRFRFLIFYLTCGVLAAAAHVLTGPQSEIPTVGASGAVAGIMGAYIILFPNATILALVPVFFISTLMEVPALIVIGFWALMQFLNANWFGGGEMLRGGGVAYFAHIGGFVAGILLILMLGGKRLTERRAGRDHFFR